MGGKMMEKVIVDVRVYANYVIERLNQLKESNRDKLTRNEIDVLNDAANLIQHNLEVLKEV